MKQEKNLPFVSIIMPNLHSPIIDKVITALLKQTYLGRVEIIVVGMDKFNLLSKFKANKKLKIINTKKPTIPSTARNIGIKKAKGDFLLFLDADCLVNPEWISQLLNNYKSNRNQIVGGSFCLEKSVNFWRLCDNLSHFYAISSRQKKKQVRDLFSANLSLPRGVIKKVGFFNEKLRIGEDRDFLMRALEAGYPLVLEPAATATHFSNKTTFASILKHSYGWGQHSIGVRIKYTDVEGVPVFMRNWLTLVLLSPMIALLIAFKVYAKSLSHLLYFCVFPIIFLSKLFWCLGAARALKNK